MRLRNQSEASKNSSLESSHPRSQQLLKSSDHWAVELLLDLLDHRLQVLREVDMHHHQAMTLAVEVPLVASAEFSLQFWDFRVRFSQLHWVAALVLLQALDPVHQISQLMTTTSKKKIITTSSSSGRHQIYKNSSSNTHSLIGNLSERHFHSPAYFIPFSWNCKLPTAVITHRKQ